MTSQSPQCVLYVNVPSLSLSALDGFLLDLDPMSSSSTKGAAGTSSTTGWGGNLSLKQSLLHQKTPIGRFLHVIGLYYRSISCNKYYYHCSNKLQLMVASILYNRDARVQSSRAEIKLSSVSYWVETTVCSPSRTPCCLNVGQKTQL